MANRHWKVNPRSGKRKAGDDYGSYGYGHGWGNDQHDKYSRFGGGGYQQEPPYSQGYGNRMSGGFGRGYGGMAVNKELQKFNMMQQIAELECELQGGFGYGGYGGGSDQNYYGAGPSRDMPPGRRRRKGRTPSHNARRRDRKKSGGARQSEEVEDEEEDPYYTSCGRGVRHSGKEPKPGSNANADSHDDRRKSSRFHPRRDDTSHLSELPSKESVHQLIEFMKTFEDIEDDPEKTVVDGIKQSGVKLTPLCKFTYLYLDGLVVGHSSRRPLRDSIYRDALRNMRNLTVDEIFNKSEKLERSEERKLIGNALYTPLEFSVKPFEERLALFSDAIINSDRVGTVIQHYGAMYCLNIPIVIYKLPNTGSKFEFVECRVYVNEICLAKTSGRTTNYVTFTMYKLLKELFQTKTVSEIIAEHSKTFKEDMATMTLESIVYRGCGYVEEDNALVLRNYHELHPRTEKPKLGDLILIEKEAWCNSPFETVEESARRSGMLVKWTTDVLDPKIVQTADYAREKNGKKLVEIWYNVLMKGYKQARADKNNVYTCKLEIEDEIVGIGLGTTKKEAMRSASQKALDAFRETQTVLKFSNKAFFTNTNIIMLADIKKEAERIRAEEMPEAPDYSDIFEDGFGTYGPFPDSEDKGDGEDKADGEEEEKPKDDKTGNSENKDESKDETKAPEPEKTEEEKYLVELGPWMKEVVTRHLKKFLNSEAYFGLIVFSSRQPDFMRDFIRSCCFKFRLFRLRARTQNSDRIIIHRNNLKPTLKEITTELIDCTDNTKDGYKLCQLRQDDGTIKQYQFIGNRWGQGRRTGRKRNDYSY